jgi:hypothetical protein
MVHGMIISSMKHTFDDPLAILWHCYDYPCGSALVGFQED